MLPDYSTCMNRIQNYLSTYYTSKGWGCQLPGGVPDSTPSSKVRFRAFWDYKTNTERQGSSILSSHNLPQTAQTLREFLLSWGMGRTGVADAKKMQQILIDIQPYYNRVKGIKLGSGSLQQFKAELENIFDGLGGITNNVDYTGNESAVVGKSKTLLAIWGETPGFDSLVRKKLIEWTHQPAPLTLPHLRAREIWYKPTEFCDMILELDRWVSAWPKHNNGKVFSQSFASACPNTPAGRLIDMIYRF